MIGSGATEFPKVFKLRTGSGSAHVKLVKKPNDAKRLINQAFGIGFSQYDKFANLRERWTKYKIGKVNFKEVLKGIVRLGYTTNFAKVAGRERGYIYFQDFIPDNNFDNRVIVIDGKACAIKRKNRENDFRASGSGILSYDKENFSEKMIKQSFKIAEAINSKSLAIDYVFKGREPMIVELSYGFPSGSFVDDCPGYWDRELNWHPGPFDAQGWMVESLLDS
ncbi:hypothetical protein [Rhodohalobacter sp.]|uniref:hypothetical protein n=1 Tax=Rhodohalobacter sp. TaxID=1974210 RepID=UPI002ACE5F0B|nr:hypothetical protein [Rhodohalobacter sp.]MDZ7755191.1 hypothetical protein [Rhodohalobacter sp.]